MNIFRRMSWIYIMQHVISSLAYRMLLLCFGLYIVLSHENIYPSYAYYIIMGLYVLLYYQLIDNRWKYARLMLDITLILIVLFGKFPLTEVGFVYALFPLISSTIYTGVHNKYWPVFLITIVLLCILDHGFVLGHQIVALVIWAAGFQSWMGSRTNNLVATITGHIDNYFADNDGSRRPHYIYQNIIEEINKFLKEDYIKEIYCYLLDDEGKIWLVNSSKFLWKRTLNLNKNIIERLQKNKAIDDSKHNTLYYYVEKQGVCYIYICKLSPSHHEFGFRKEYVLKYVLDVTFGKVSNVLASEYRIAEMRRKTFEETKGHIDYVSRALKVMHFIRNKLSPIKSVITFYSSMDTMDEKVRQRMEPRIKQEVKQARQDLNELVLTANYLLDKQNNPYSGADIEDVNIKLLFVILSEIAEFHLGGVVNVSEEIENAQQRRTVRVSKVQLKVLFTDIISNISKYCQGYFDISMYIDSGDLVIDFLNDYPNNMDQECRNLMRDINNPDNDAIVQRNSHGISNIKSAASIMKIGLSAKVANDSKMRKYTLTTRFKLYDISEDISS